MRGIGIPKDELAEAGMAVPEGWRSPKAKRRLSRSRRRMGSTRRVAAVKDGGPGQDLDS